MTTEESRVRDEICIECGHNHMRNADGDMCDVWMYICCQCDLAGNHAGMFHDPVYEEAS